MDKDSTLKKCSRCRLKRIQETEEELNRYLTCLKCRNKRKLVKKTRLINIEQEIAKSGLGVDTDKLHFKYPDFLEQIKNNRYDDLTNIRLIGFVDTIHKYSVEEVDSQPNPDQFYLNISKNLTKTYIEPLTLVTGFKFVIRDYHKGGLNIKKIAIVFVCSQDKTKKRKSRSKFKRVVSNKLKIYECFSKINLYYDLITRKIVLNYSHKSHENCLEERGDLLAESIDYDLSTHIQDIAVAAVDNFLSISNIDHRLMG